MALIYNFVKDTCIRTALEFEKGSSKQNSVHSVQFWQAPRSTLRVSATRCGPAGISEMLPRFSMNILDVYLDLRSEFP
nr:hypothetical protein [uncultured bacterium]